MDYPNTDFGPYYYKILTLDSCGNEVLESQISRTILLTGSSSGDYVNNLEWTEYFQWLGGNGTINSYLTVNDITSPIPIATFSPGDTTFSQSVLDNFYSDGNFCYTIEYIEAAGNPYFYQDSSRSNTVCIVQQPIIFIPSAFHPGGFLNDIFYPSNAFVSSKNYSLLIFNRWGEKIFETNDPKVGWDGTTNGKAAPEAVYIYLLKTTQPDGTEIRKKGSVTLIR
jgi:gliding motility-associated-like protein